MVSLFRLLQIKRFFFLPVTVFLVTLMSLLILYPEARSFFIINGIHFPAADVFFKYFTNAGDGVFAVIVGVLVLLFYRYGAGMAFLLGFAATGGLNSLLKNFVFPDSPRPFIHFWNNARVHYVEGVAPHLEYSFPSGHSNTAFFVFTFLALLRWRHDALMQFVCAVCACLAAYSRVYLGQHFVGDITAGAYIGIAGALAFYTVYRKLKNYPALNRNVMNSLRRK